MLEQNDEPSTVSVDEAVQIVPFKVKLPTYFPFDVQFSQAQLYPSHPTDVVFSFWQTHPIHQEVTLHISKEKVKTEKGQSITLPHQTTANYRAWSGELG